MSIFLWLVEAIALGVFVGEAAVLVLWCVAQFALARRRVHNRAIVDGITDRTRARLREQLDQKEKRRSSSAEANAETARRAR